MHLVIPVTASIHNPSHDMKPLLASAVVSISSSSSSGNLDLKPPSISSDATTSVAGAASALMLDLSVAHQLVTRKPE